MTAPADPIASGLARVRERIATAARGAGREPSDVELLVVTKRRTPAEVSRVIEFGAAALGENYVQEARAKIPQVRGARWHLIGPLQTNKARFVPELFTSVESVDRAEIVEALARRARAAGRTLEVLVQVNVAREPGKSGAPPETVATLLEQLASLPSLDATGLMTIPPAGYDPDEARLHFRALARLAGLSSRGLLPAAPVLSMGMSHDLEVAIEEGATRVRIGTAIFGPRDRAAG